MPKSIHNYVVQSLLAIMMALTLTACETNSFDPSQPLLGGEAIDDSPLVSDVKAALRSNGQTALLRLTVTAVDDVIILKGLVSNDQERYTAVQVAGSVEGVRYVTDNIYLR